MGQRQPDIVVAGVQIGGHRHLLVERDGGHVGAAGGEVVRPKFSIGQYGHIALAKDTEGNLIGLHSMQ